MSRPVSRPVSRPRFQVVATDLDGTLLRSDGTVSPRTRAALDRVQRAGALLVLVTGRPPRWLPPVTAQIGHRGQAVCANGAVVYDLASERVLRTYPLPGPAALRLVAALRERLPQVRFAVEAADGEFGHEPGYRPRLAPAEARVAPVEWLLARGPAVKLLARAPGTGSDDLLALAGAAGAGLPLTATHSSASADDGLLEVAAGGVTKASTLAELVGALGVSAAQVLAFGDMPNDVPLLTWAGWGVAVAGAHAAARAAADEVATGNDDDGVAAVLERLFP